MSPGERRRFSKAAGREGAEMSLVPRTAHGGAVVMRVWKRENAEPERALGGIRTRKGVLKAGPEQMVEREATGPQAECT